MHRFAVLPLLTMVAGCTPLLGLDDRGDASVDATAAHPADAGPCDACGAGAASPEASLDAAVDSGADVTSDARADAAEARDGAGPPGQAVYNGGQVLFDVTSLVAVYWGPWPAAVQNECQTDLEPFLPWVAQTSFLQPITQYWGFGGGQSGTLDDGGAPTKVAIMPPSLAFQPVRHFCDPQAGGIDDPDVFVESIADGDPGTIYVTFFGPDSPLCGGRSGCSGLTPNLHVPYIRVQYGDGTAEPVVSASRAAFRELVDVITDGDGAGWSVSYDGGSYGLGSVCSRATAGGGLGNEATVRFWDQPSRAPDGVGFVYATDGMWSALSGGQGRCINSLVTRGFAATVDADGGTTVFSVLGGQAPLAGASVLLLPPANDVSIAAARLGINWDGVWAMATDGGGAFTQAYPYSNDLTQTWGSSSYGAALPAGYGLATSMDTTMQGDGRWDTFTVGYKAEGDDASAPGAQLFHFYFDTSSIVGASSTWGSFGDGTGLPGITGIVSGPGATSYAPGRIDAFVRGAAGDGSHLLPRLVRRQGERRARAQHQLRRADGLGRSREAIGRRRPRGRSRRRLLALGHDRHGAFRSGLRGGRRHRALVPV